MAIINLNAMTNLDHLDCPDRPSCVSSLANDPRRRIGALSCTGPPSQALDRLAKIVEVFPGGAVRGRTDRSLSATFTSRVFGFVDDVDFVIRTSTHIDVRSMSRTGYYDFGVNRARIERIRREFSSSSETFHQCTLHRNIKF